MFDPYITIQMGHFIRTSIAVKNKFNEAMNTGEDFDYYLRIWEASHCIKIMDPIFINRRGLHSTGLKSADGKMWRENVDSKIADYRIKYQAQLNSIETIEKLNNKTFEYSAYAKKNNIANHNTYFQLSRYFPFYGN